MIYYVNERHLSQAKGGKSNETCENIKYALFKEFHG